MKCPVSYYALHSICTKLCNDIYEAIQFMGGPEALVEWDKTEIQIPYIDKILDCSGFMDTGIHGTPGHIYITYLDGSMFIATYNDKKWSTDIVMCPPSPSYED